MCAAVSWKLRQIRQSSWEQTRQFSPCSSQTWVPQSAHSPNSSLPHGYPNASATCATSMISQYPGTCPLCLQCRVQLEGISTRVPKVCSKRFVQSNSGNIRRATLAHVRVGVLVAVVTPVVRPGSRQLTNCRRTEATTPHRQLKGEAVDVESLLQRHCHSLLQTPMLQPCPRKKQHRLNRTTRPWLNTALPNQRSGLRRAAS
jgi:hypothetical protein